MKGEKDIDEDLEIISLLEEKENGDEACDDDKCVRSQYISSKLFYFFFFSAQGSLVPYISLYYKQLKLTAAQAGIVTGAKMYVAFLVIPLWSFMVDKFKIGKPVFIMSSTALIITMLTISLAPGKICATEQKTTRENWLPGLSQTSNISSEDSNLESNYQRIVLKTTAFDHTDLFLFLLLVTICGTIFSCPCLSLADSGTVDLLAQNSETHKYGKQRLWGSIGNGLAAFIVGISISQTNLCPGENRKINYYICFYIFSMLMFLAVVAGSRLKFNLRTKSSQGTIEVCKSLCQVLMSFEYFIFLFTVFFDGVAMSFIKAFLFWFLKDIGGSQILFSVIKAVNSCLEVLVYFLSSYLIQRLGTVRVLCIGLICYVVRFSFYTFLTNPWFVLVVEPLSGITTAALWAAIMSHVGTTAHDNSVVTLQGVIHCIHWGLGHGTGTVIGGVLIHNIGARYTFALFAIVSLLNFFLYIPVLYGKRSSKRSNP